MGNYDASNLRNGIGILSFAQLFLGLAIALAVIFESSAPGHLHFLWLFGHLLTITLGFAVWSMDERMKYYDSITIPLIVFSAITLSLDSICFSFRIICRYDCDNVQPDTASCRDFMIFDLVMIAFIAALWVSVLVVAIMAANVLGIHTMYMFYLKRGLKYGKPDEPIFPTLLKGEASSMRNEAYERVFEDEDGVNGDEPLEGITKRRKSDKEGAMNFE